METFSALLAIFAGNSPVTGEFPSQRPVTRSFDVFFDLRLNKHLGKQSLGWWLETTPCSLWRHCNDSKWQDSNGICGSKSGLGKGGQEEPFKHHEFQYQDYMMTLSEIFSALLALCEGNCLVTGEFSSQRPVTPSFDVFFDLRLNKRWSKQPRRRWLETPSCSLWRSL